MPHTLRFSYRIIMAPEKMVLALIIIIRIISILGLFVNSSVVGSVNTNLKKITLYSMRTQKEMVSVPVFYCLQIKKKKQLFIGLSLHTSF